MRRTGLIVAFLAVGLAGACSDSSMTAGGNGSTKVLLTDAPPAGALGRVDLYVKSIEASTSLDTSCPINALCSSGASWVTIATPQKTFNLLDFQNGATALAGEVNLPAGQYQAVRVVINTSLSSVADPSGAPISVQWPVSGELTLYAFVEHALDVPAGGAQIVIDFDVAQTFPLDGTGGVYFIPVIRAVNTAETGAVAGLVTGPDVAGNPTPIAGAYVLLMLPQGGGGVSTRTDASGHYTAAFVREGNYTLEVQGTGMSSSSPVSVAAGQTTTKNVVLIRDSSGTDTTGTGGGGGGGGPDTTTTGGGTPTGPVATVTIQPASQAISVGDSVPLVAITANAQGQALTGRAVTWSLSDSTKVTVFGSFGNWMVLRGKQSGTVTVTATSEGKSGSGTVVIR